MTVGVSIAYAHPGTEVTHSFSQSLLYMTLHDAANEGHIIEGGMFPLRCGTNGLVAARNMAVKAFLAKNRAEWLLWIDTDMGFERDALDKLLSVADAVTAPIVGGLCFGQKETEDDGFYGYRTEARPTIFNWVTVEGKDAPTRFTARSWYPPNALVPCAGTGSAFILIHRSVFEKLEAEYGETWYDQIYSDDGEKIGEDICFCIRANAQGFPIHVYTGVRTTHQKHLWLQELDFWDQHKPPPATIPTAVLVPVLERPQNALPFMQSLRASTGLATVYAVAQPSDTDTWQAWDEAGATIIPASGKRFGIKINDGYRNTTEDLLFITGDDVKFWPGWLDHAQHAMNMSGCAVIGTNDLGNPRTMRGEHATHMLIRRDYIDQHGASWDGPGTVCHEGYRHWFVDDEIVTAAKTRSMFVAALGSKVEHLHPIWKKANMDSTYQLGTQFQKADKRLFEQRAKANVNP